jgi:hypothetical protein
MVSLAELLPGPSLELWEAFADYARTPGAVVTLRKIFSEHDQLEPLVLRELAKNPANTDLVLALATRSYNPSKPAPEWQGTLLTSLVNAKEYEKADAVWRTFTGVPPVRSIFNPQFARLNEPPPFNWSYAANEAGVAEPGNGGLNILYFGRQDVTLARQVILLVPGEYQLNFRVSGELPSPGALRLALTCLPTQHPLLDSRVASLTEGRVFMRFRVPEADCRAQQLQLLGVSQEYPRTVEVQMGALDLRRGP